MAFIVSWVFLELSVSFMYVCVGLKWRNAADTDADADAYVDADDTADE